MYIILIFLGICFTLVALLYYTNILERFIFQPGASHKSHVYSLDVPFEEIYLDARDGARIHMIHIKCDDPSFAIIYFHGNRGSLQRWAGIASRLNKFGCEIFIMDYRGYGKSTGLRTEATLYRDAKQVFEHVKRISILPIIVYGRSLGTGIATWLSANTQVDGLILESPYFDFESLVFDFVLLPKKAKRKLPLNYRFDNFSNLKNVDVRTLIIHGEKDKVIKIYHARKLHTNLEHSMMDYVEIKEGDHFNLDRSGEYEAALKKYFAMLKRS